MVNARKVYVNSMSEIVQILTILLGGAFCVKNNGCVNLISVKFDGAIMRLMNPITLVVRQ